MCLATLRIDEQFGVNFKVTLSFLADGPQRIPGF